MISIKIEKNRKYIYVEVSGHAEYAEKGSDIVCAGVSTLYQAFIRAADERGLVSSLWDDDVLAVRVIRCGESEKYFNVLKAGLGLLMEQYGEFMQLTGEK